MRRTVLFSGGSAPLNGAKSRVPSRYASAWLIASTSKLRPTACTKRRRNGERTARSEKV